MNWKKVLHSVICLLVVCSILLTMVPVKAEAVLLESGLAIGIAACLILATAGVVFNPETVEDIKAIGNSFQTYMYQWGEDNSKQTEVQEGLSSIVIINPFGASDGEDDGSAEDDGSWESPNDTKIKLARGILKGITAWVGAVILNQIAIEKPGSEKLSTFSATSLGSQQPPTGIYNAIYTFGKEYPSETTSLFEQLGVADKVAVLAISNSEPYNFQGIYFDQSGALTTAFFDNPYDLVNASLFGVYSLSDLTVVGEPKHVQVGSSLYYVYYSKAYAEEKSDYLTSDVAAFDFSKTFYRNSSSSYGFYYYVKSSTSTTMSSSSLGCDFNLSFFYNWSQAYLPHMSTVTWDYQSLLLEPSIYVGDVPSDLQEGNITEEEIPLVDIDYSQVLPQGQTALQSIQSLAGQLESGSMTYEDYLEKIKIDSESDSGGDIETDGGTDTGTLGQIQQDSFWAKLTSTLASPFEWLADTVMSGIKSIFVPSEDFLSSKVTALRERFSFVDSIIGTAEFIRDSINGDVSPPVIYIDLSAAEGSYYLGEKVILVDFAWYERYKDSVDALMSAILWAFFAWRVFQRAPAIIGGDAGVLVRDFMAEKSFGRKKD